MNGGRVVASADEVLKALDALEADLNRLRKILADSFTTEAVITDFNISAIRWLTKDKEPASPEERWSWAFAYDREGKPVDPALIDALKRYGKIRVGDYEFSLGGRDGHLLNRRLVKR